MGIIVTGDDQGNVACYNFDFFELWSMPFKNLTTEYLIDLKLVPEKLKILRNYVEYNPININASLNNALMFIENGDFNNAVISVMVVWFNVALSGVFLLREEFMTWLHTIQVRDMVFLSVQTMESYIA